ncbi:MAG: secretin N-terminal domain-containing protein [Planctomycetota bacterium]
MADLEALITRTDDLFARQAVGRGLTAEDRPEIESDAAGGSLVLSGDSVAIDLWAQSLEQARRLMPPATEGRFIDLRQRAAAEVIAPLQELFALAAADQPAAASEPQISVIERTNQLFVRAEPAQLATIERLVRQLDTIEPSELPPLRLLQVRTADVASVADLLRRRYDRRSPEQRRDEPVTVEADAATNTLVITASEAMYEEIKAFVDTLNATASTGAERETMIFPLRRARATDLAQALDQLYPEPPMPRDFRGRPLPALQEPREVSVTADAATNTLIIEAPAERRPSFEALVERLDRVELPPRATLRTYRVERGDPAQLARTLQDLARRGVMNEQPADGGKPVEVLVQAEPRSRTLIVAGDEVTFRETERLLADLEMVPVRRQLRVFTVPGADLDQLADQARRLYAEQTAEFEDAGDVSVEVDREAGALFVVADDEAMGRFAGILDQLRRTAPPPPDVRLIPLQHAAAAEVASFLAELSENNRSLTGDRGAAPGFEAIERTNSLLVAATREQHVIVRELVASLDRPETAEMPPLRILRLESADAGNLASALLRQYDARPPEERRDKPVRISADAPTNSLVVAAHPEVLPEIQSIVAELNAAGQYDAEGREIRIFPLKVARAQELARTLDEMFPPPPPPVDRFGRPIRGVQPPREVVVRADAQTNAIIVDAPLARMAGFERLVEQLDRQQPVEETAIRTYEVVNVDAADVAEVLRRLAAEGALLDAAGDRRASILVNADPATRRLVVSGPVEAVDRIERVLEDLDVRPSDPGTTLKFFTLEHARAESVAAMLREVLLVRVREEVDGAVDRPERLIDVSADRATNTLILSVPEALLPVAEQLIQRLDMPAAAVGQRTIRVRPLMFASAEEVGRTLGGVIGAMTSPSTGDPLDARIVPAGGSNAVILVGVPTDLDVVEALIEPLDERPSRDAVDARTFRLEYAEAVEIGPILRTLLEDREGGDPRVVIERIRRSRGTYEPPAPIRVEADGRTNSLIVSGPGRTVTLAEQLLERLDQPREAGETVARVFTPRRGRAGDLAAIVRRLAELEGFGPRQVRVDLEAATASIIVAGRPEPVARVVALLEQRDAAAVVAPLMELTVFDLRSADPRVIAGTVQAMLRDRGRWPQELLAVRDAGLPVAEPAVTADPAGGRVLVSAPGPLAAMAGAIIEQLDREPVGGAVDVRVFSLREARAEQVAAAMRDAMAAEAARTPGMIAPSIVAEASSNAVVVTATESQLGRIEQLVAGMDEAGGPPDRQRVRTVVLQHARAEAVAPIVERLLGDPEDDADPFGGRFFFNRRGPVQPESEPELRVAADPRLNAVVISATPGILAAAEEMVRQLDVPSGGGDSAGRSVRVLSLQAADASEVAVTLSGIFEDEAEAGGEPAPVIRVDGESNSLVIRAGAEQYAVIERTVRTIDRASLAGARQLRVLPVDPSRASAADVAAALERLLGGGQSDLVEFVPLESLVEPKAPAAAPATAPPAGGRGLRSVPEWPWDVPAFDPGAAPASITQSIFRQVASVVLAAPWQPVVAPDGGHEPAGIGSLLRGGVLTDLPLEPVAIPVVPAAAAPAAAVPAAESPARLTPTRPSVADLMRRAKAAIASEDAEDADTDDSAAAATTPATPVAVAEVALPAAVAIEPAEPAVDDPAADGPPVTIAVDPESNAIVVLGPPRSLERIERLARQVAEQLPSAARPVRAIPLPASVDVNRVRQLTVEVLRRMAPAGGTPGQLVQRTGIVADETTNTLFVVAADADFRTIGRLVAGFATGGAAEGMTVRVYPLTSTTPSRAEAALRALLEGESTGRGRRGRQADRVLAATVTVPGTAGGDAVAGELDAESVRIVADESAGTLLVMAPERSLAVLDAFVALIDQSPVTTGTSLRLFPLRNARAEEVEPTLGRLLRSRFDAMRSMPGGPQIRPGVSADRRTNTLIVSAAPEQMAEVEGLLEDLDRDLGGQDTLPLEVVVLQRATPREVARLIEEVVLGNDATRRARATVTPDDASGRLLLRVDPELRPEIDAVIAAVDGPAGAEVPVRTIVLERADAEAVAESLQRFFDDRASLLGSRGGRRGERAVSIVGNSMSRTLLVSGSEADLDRVAEMVARFDSAEAADSWDYRLVRLEHARARDLAQTVNSLVYQLQEQAGTLPWMRGRGGGRPTRERGSISVWPDDRLNALVITGAGESFELIEQVVAMLDAPEGESSGDRVLTVYPVPGGADATIAAELLESVFGDGPRRWWEEPDPDGVQIRSDRRTGVLFVVATAEEHEAIAAFIDGMGERLASAGSETAVIALEYAPARELADTVADFLRDQARAAGNREPASVVAASPSTRAIVVSGPAEELALIRELVAKLDAPDAGGDRVTEILNIADGDASTIARIVREQFRDRGDAVRVTVDERSNAIIVTAPRAQVEAVASLVGRLDTRQAGDETIVRTFALAAADAQEAQEILSTALELDSRGRTEGTLVKLEADGDAVEVVARVVADRRSNSLVVTATPESFPVIEQLIRDLDEAKAAAPVDYRIIDLEHAFVDDVSYTLTGIRDWPGTSNPTFVTDRVENRLVVTATADQFELIQRIVSELDQPRESGRTTEFIPLEFADAEKVRSALGFFYGSFALEADTPGKRNVRITANPATNSLIISADEPEWAGIRALLEELDSPEYDASLQLQVIALVHADAPSVAAAINEAFAGPAGGRANARGQRQPQGRGEARGNGGQEAEGERRDREAPAQLVAADEWVRASAEPLTNSLIVSANRRNLARIEAVVRELDVPDVERLPAPRLIPVTAGDPRQVAESLNRLYAEDREASRGMLRIVGDPASGTVIVRAEDATFDQIRAVAGSLMAAGRDADLQVAVLRPEGAPAARIAEAIRAAYQAKAQRRGTTLTLEVDAANNALVVSTAADLLAEIRGTVDELAALSPGAGQGILIIDLEHVDAAAVQRTIRQIGLDRPARDASTRIVTEPVTATPMAGRNALIVLASPADQDTVLALVKSIDREPAMAAAFTRIVRLQQARASAVAGVLDEILDPAEQQASTPLARAAREQVRRLTVRRDGLDEADLDLDLATPIRVVADDGANTLIVSSTEANVAAVIELARTLDTVPLLDGLTVQILPLQNIQAADFVRIARDLFQQGRNLGRVPGSDLAGVPGGTVGRALLDEVAISVDARTNTVVVAGTEDAVALVEVLGQRLDADVATGWVEPRILVLRHADAAELAGVLQEVLVDGVGSTQAGPLREQVGRLRMLRRGAEGGEPGDAPVPGDFGRVIESDVFQPMQRLVIRPDIRMNALILVGTPDNLDVVDELTAMLDVPAASADATVRLYPVRHASASRLAQTLVRLVDQQVSSRSLRPEDRLVVEADERTNTLVASSSRRTFALVESLLETLDAPMDPSLRDIRRIDLQTASASRVASLVQQMMDARLERLRRVQPETADLERATVLADARTNSLIVAAGTESFGVIEQLVADLDTSRPDDALLEVVAVAKASTERLAETIGQVMERRYAGLPADVRRTQQPLVITDPRTSSLLVAASPGDLADIRSLVERLDAAPSDPAVGLHVIQLPARASADALASRLERLVRERQQSAGESRPSDRVSIEPEPGSNTLIVAANREQLEVVRGLVDVLVAAGEEASEAEGFDVIALASSRAEYIVELVEELYVEKIRDTRGDNAISVTAAERINAVLVKAAPADIDAIRALVKRLDGEKPAAVVEIRTIALKSASAIEAVDIIQDVIEGSGGGRFRRGASAAQATVLRYFGQLAGRDLDGDGEPDVVPGTGGEFEVSAAVRDQIRLTPDSRTNSIIVRAPGDAMELIERLVSDLDATSIGNQNIRIFKLVNADATAMSEILGQLFNLNRRRDAFVLRPTDQGAGGAAGGGAGIAAMPEGELPGGFGGFGDAALTAVPDQRPQLAITVDSRTNSLLISGTPTYLDLVSRVVEELDALEANERETFVVRLRNSEAAEIARVLGEFVREEQQKLVSTLGGDQIGSAARLLEREITITGDTASNAVLVSASPRYAERVRELIEALDVDPPQVLIQVLLAEVTLDTSDQFGVDFNADIRVDDVTLGPAFGLASAFVGGVGTPSLSVVGKDFQMLLQAIQSQGRVQVLSNPAIMAANNQPAQLFVGERIRIADASGLTEGGNINTSTTEEQVGITLNVTPSINPDGFVRLSVLPELSALTQRTTQINEDLETPIITERSASTTVTVRDGQTIVIGGLISDRYEFRRRKVPFFGDLPLIGALFRNDEETSLKTELLIVLTPHVIQSPAETDRIDRLTDREVDRLTLPSGVQDQIRRGLFQGGGLYDAEGQPIEWGEVFEDLPSRPGERPGSPVPLDGGNDR